MCECVSACPLHPVCDHDVGSVREALNKSGWVEAVGWRGQKHPYLLEDRTRPVFARWKALPISAIGFDRSRETIDHA